MKKQYSTYPNGKRVLLVKGVLTHWRLMEGDTTLEKKINAYLTATYISNECLADECIAVTRRLLKFKTKDSIKKELARTFNYGVGRDYSGIASEVLFYLIYFSK
jgi:hypothetical protein